MRDSKVIIVTLSSITNKYLMGLRLGSIYTRAVHGAVRPVLRGYFAPHL